MGRVANERTGHVQRLVLPAATRLLIEAACREEETRPLSSVATVNMGSSPKGKFCNDSGEGIPLLGGPSDLGTVYPEPSRWTTTPTKRCKKGDILVCVRATIGEPRWSDGEYCVGRGLAAVYPQNGDVSSDFLFHVIEGAQDNLRDQGTGTTFKTISKRHLEAVSVPMLDAREQVSIGAFLRWLAIHDGDQVNWSVAPQLPPRFEEQRRIVAKIERLAAKIDEAHSLRDCSVTELTALLPSRLYEIGESLNYGGTLQQVLAGKPRNGWSAKCDNAEDGVPVLTLSAVTGYEFDPKAIKRTSLPTEGSAHYWLEDGDLLITRSNTPALVGHAAIYAGEPYPCIYPDLMMRVPVNHNEADKRFVWYWLQTPQVRDYIIANAKGTSPTMKKISQGTVMAIPFPVKLPLDEQRCIVTDLDALRAKVGRLKVLQKKIAIELGALLPSILDKAFKGEL